MTANEATDYIPPSQRIDLGFPEENAASISPHRVHNGDAFVAPFGAAAWPLAALDSSFQSSPTIHFKGWPEGFQNFARHVAYVLINHGNPESFVEQLGMSAVRWPSTGSIAGILHQLRLQINWLTRDWSRSHPATPVKCPSDLDPQHLDDLKIWIEQHYSKARQRGAALSENIRLWHLNPWLPEDCQWPEPLWRHHQWQPKRPKEENKSLPIAEATFGPLLEWATAFVTSFAPDILAAHRHLLTPPNRAVGMMTATNCLAWYATTGTPLPPSPNSWSTGIGWQVLTYRHAIPRQDFTRVFKGKLKQSLVVSKDFSLTMLDLPVTGKFHGRAWIPFIGVYDMPTLDGGWRTRRAGPLFNHLRTACLIVVSALTGMRPEEVLNLQAGCAREPIQRPGGSRLYLIDGLVFKGIGRAKDGSPRDPRPAVWATIPVAANAIHTMEQLNEVLGCSGPLFSMDGSNCVTTQTAVRWVESFIDFVNERLAPHTANPKAFTVQPDPDGNLCLTRFRRTLAWFVRHRPNGDVITAIQYQHVSTVMGEGYAGTKASGMPDLLLEEDWNHRASTIRNLENLLSAGGGVSGPAAESAIKATRRLPRLLLPSEERQVRKDPSLMVYENPSALALCIFDEEKALCRKLKDAGKDNRPNLLGCIDGCLNCARTDDHLKRLSHNANALQAQAELVPLPMAQSMRAEADRIERLVRDFSSTRKITEERLPECPPNNTTNPGS